MTEFVFTVAPVIAKLALSHFVGPIAGQLGEPVLRYTMKIFKEEKDARQAANLAENLGKAVAEQILTSLTSDGITPDEMTTVGRELAYTLSQLDVEEILIKGKMNEARISRILSESKIPIGLNSREVDYLRRALSYTGVYIRRVSTSFSAYGIKRDEQILLALEEISSNVNDLVSGIEDVKRLIESMGDLVGLIKNREGKLSAEFERSYIEKIIRMLNYVEILGLSDAERLNRESNLDVAYLSLYVSQKGSIPSDFTQAVASISRSSGKLIIEGGAGSGKSTLMRWAAVNSSRLSEVSEVKRSWLSDLVFIFGKRDAVNDSKRNNTITSIEGKLNKKNDLVNINIRDHVKYSNKTAGGTGLFRKWALDMVPEFSQESVNRIPFLVRLRDVDNDLPGVDDLAVSLSAVMPKPPSGWVEECLNSGRALLLFDGVDEVPEGGRRDNILRGIASFSTIYPKTAIIVTTRPHAFDPSQSGLGNFAVAAVEDLNPEQQRQFVSNWHRARATYGDIHSDVGFYENLAETLKGRFENSPVLAKLATNPLLCAAICLLHEHNSETLPEDERSLCAELTEMLVHKRDRTSGRSRSIDMQRFNAAYQMSYEKKKALLARLAVEMLRGGSSHLKIAEAEKVLPAALREAAQGDLDPAVVCRALLARSGVLRAASYQSEKPSSDGRGSNELLPEAVEFIHNRFKEWLASTYFLSQGTHGELVRRADEEGFDQVCVFAAAAPDQQNFVSSLIGGLFDRADAISDQKSKRRLQILVVRCALVSQTLPDETRSKADELGKRLLPPKSMDEGKALADLGDLAVPKLGYKKSRSAREATYCIRCLSLIDTPNARRALEAYREDAGWTVAEELSRHVNPLTIPAVLKAVTTKADSEAVDNTLQRIKRRIKDVGKNQIPEGTTFLDLSWTSIEDITELENLSVLRSLSLDHTRVKDLRPISNIRSLKELSLEGTRIKNLELLKTLDEIETLDLSDNLIEDISPLSHMKELKYLVISHTSVSDISVLRELKRITYFLASDSRVSDIGPLSCHHSLEYINLSHCNVVDILPVGELKQLTHLFLHGNPVSDIGPLRGLVNLTELDLGRTKVVNIDALSGNTKMVSLGLHGVGVEDVSALKNKKNMRSLYLGETKVKDISALSGMKNLEHLVLVGTLVEDLSPILHNEDMTIYTPSGDMKRVSDLKDSARRG